MNWAGIITAIVVVSGAVYVTERVLDRFEKEPKVEVREKTITQVVTLPGVEKRLIQVVTQYITNPAAAAEITNRLWELTKYRTLPGWIAVSNDRIWAGLVARIWNAEYHVNERANVAGAFGGTMFGGLYLRRLGPFWVGGLAGAGDGKAQVAGIAAWSW